MSALLCDWTPPGFSRAEKIPLLNLLISKYPDAGLLALADVNAC